MGFPTIEKKPMFSVVIPLYNKQEYVYHTVQGVLKQSYSDFELIVVDDGSTDDSLECLSAFDDHRLRVVRQNNSGVGSARNRGVSHAKGEWVAFLDADDNWLVGHLLELKRVIELHPQSGMVSTTFIERNHGDEEPETGLKAGKINEVDYFNMASKNIGFINSSTVAIKRCVFDELGGFSDYRLGEDLEFWARVALDHTVAVSSAITAIYNRNTGGVMEAYNGLPVDRKLGEVIDLKDISASVGMLLEKLDSHKYSEKRKSIVLYINSRVYRASLARLLGEDVMGAKCCSSLFLYPKSMSISMFGWILLLPQQMLILLLQGYRCCKGLLRR